MLHRLAAAVVALLCLSVQAAIREEPVTYKDADTIMKGFIVYDDATTAKRPGVIVVHEWWGITKHVHDEARNFAAQGYTAFIADMYGDGKTADNPKDAIALFSSVGKNPGVMHSRFRAARQTLAKHPTVDASRLGAAGYCFGGSVVLEMARTGEDLKGVVAFHANPTPVSGPVAAGVVKAKLLVLNGEADPLVKPDAIGAFKSEMSAAKADYRWIDYPGALHAYTNPEATEKGKQFNMPIAYDANADKQSKAEAARFFADVLKR